MRPNVANASLDDPVCGVRIGNVSGDGVNGRVCAGGDGSCGRHHGPTVAPVALDDSRPHALGAARDDDDLAILRAHVRPVASRQSRPGRWGAG